MTAAREFDQPVVDLRPEERRVCDALLQQQRQLDRFERFAVVAQPPVFVGRWIYPDLMVVWRRTVAIEIDGWSHHGRWAADHTRDQVLNDHAIQVARIAVEDTEKPSELEEFVERVLHLARQPRLSAV